MPRLNLPLHSYKPNSSARLVNCYAEAAPAEANAPIQVQRHPGVTQTDTGDGAGRGLYVYGDTLYAVSGSSMGVVDTSGVFTPIASIGNGPRCSFADNGTQLAVCDKSSVWVYDGTSTTVQTTAGMIAGLDGYILALDGGSQFKSSSLDDAKDWPGLYFASAEGESDNLVGLVVDHREAFLAGTRTTELWYDAGGAYFPFVRSPSGFIEQGCLAADSLAKVDQSIFWLANDLTVRRLSGQTAARVSQFSVERALRTYTNTANAYAFGYEWMGHLFYVLTVPDEGTWCYDATTGEWHERKGPTTDDWRVCAAAKAYGKVWVQNIDTGAIGYLDDSTCTEFGTVRIDDVETGAIYRDANLNVIHDLEMRYRSRQLTSAASSATDYATLYISDNGGESWRLHKSKPIGDIGTKPRVIWYRLGCSRNRAFRIRFDGGGPIQIDDISVNLSWGSS